MPIGQHSSRDEPFAHLHELTLAEALRDLPSISEALAAYEQQRRGRVEKIVAFGARGSSAKVPGRFGRGMRDLGLRLCSASS